MSELSLVRAALAHGAAGPLPVPNFACSLIGLQGRSDAQVTPVATVTELPMRPATPRRPVLQAAV